MGAPVRSSIVHEASPVAGKTFARPPSASFVDLAYAAVTEAIMDRRLEPGVRVTIDEVARQLQMSTTPVREALARAAAESLLIQSHNRGFTVSPRLSEEAYHHLFDARRALELAAVKRVRPGEETLKRLKKLENSIARSRPGSDYESYRSFNQGDHLFHLTLVQGGENPFLERAWMGLHFHLHIGRLYHGTGVIDFNDAVREHRQIVEALEHSDRRAAQTLLRSHIDGAEQRLEQLMTE